MDVDAAKYVAMTTVFLTWIAITSLWADVDPLENQKLLDVGLIALTVPVVWRIVSHVDRAILSAMVKRLLLVASSAIALAGLPGLIGGARRVAALGGGPNVFARIVGVALSLLISENGAVPLRPLLVAIFGGLIVASGSRGGMISVALGVCVIIAIRGVADARRTVKLAALSAAMVAFLVGMSPIGDRVAAVFRLRVLRLTIEEQYVSGRDEIAMKAIQYWESNLWLGGGLGEFKRVTGDYPHNIILEIGAEAGLVGVVLFLASQYFFVRRLMLNWRALDPAWVGLWVMYVIAAQFSGDLFDSRAIFVMPVVALLLIRQVNGKRMQVD
ncbi:MAG TPA: O-antigen ligase family protein [Opitutaceae bacterium]|nr:O-antigen ligase family protein [Opitutaceae bacterium]